MKKLIPALITILVLLSMSLTVYAQSEDLLIMPAKQSHWSQSYVDYLNENYGTDDFFSGKNLDEYITVDDFTSLIKLTVDRNYAGRPDSTARQALVYECARIWAEKTGQDMDQIAIIQIAPYVDADQIDSRYAHGVYLAYLQEIARGRGNGVFDPKTPATYGELATMVTRTIWAIGKNSSADANTPETNASFETKARYEIQDSQIAFYFELLNLSGVPQTLTFNTGQQFEITVTDENGKEVYRYSDGKVFTEVIWEKTINAGESLKWQDVWDMTDKEGNKVQPGNYKAVIEILGRPEAITPYDKFTAELNFKIS
jgi:hypothetical protein